MSLADESKGMIETHDAHQNKGAQGAGTKQKPYEFSDLGDESTSQSTGYIDFVLDIPLEINVELGRTKMVINDLLKLGQGSVIELSKRAGETLEILANEKLVARGEVVVVNEKYGVRITEIVSATERVEGLR
jgi:flagellar motor switch protein FliN/FliY